MVINDQIIPEKAPTTESQLLPSPQISTHLRTSSLGSLVLGIHTLYYRHRLSLAPPSLHTLKDWTQVKEKDHLQVLCSIRSPPTHLAPASQLRRYVTILLRFIIYEEKALAFELLTNTIEPYKGHPLMISMRSIATIVPLFLTTHIPTSSPSTR